MGALFDVHPDAQVIRTHRDPCKTLASAISPMGTIKWMRCNDDRDSSFEPHDNLLAMQIQGSQSNTAWSVGKMRPFAVPGPPGATDLRRLNEVAGRIPSALFPDRMGRRVGRIGSVALERMGAKFQ